MSFRVSFFTYFRGSVGYKQESKRKAKKNKEAVKTGSRGAGSRAAKTHGHDRKKHTIVKVEKKRSRKSRSRKAEKQEKQEEQQNQRRTKPKKLQKLPRTKNTHNSPLKNRIKGPSPIAMLDYVQIPDAIFVVSQPCR